MGIRIERRDAESIGSFVRRWRRRVEEAGVLRRVRECSTYEDKRDAKARRAAERRLRARRDD
jgi:ribosomal protein S21